MGILFTVHVGFLLTITMGILLTITIGFLFTIVPGIQFTISKRQPKRGRLWLNRLRVTTLFIERGSASRKWIYRIVQRKVER